MPSYTENDMQNAIAAVLRGVSRHQAAKEHHVPRSTLIVRLRGAQSRQQANSDRQKLSVAEEASLAEWARIQALLGLPLTRRQLRLAA